MAISDDYNTFYYGTGLGGEEGTVEIIRPFDTPVSTPATEDIKSFIAKNDRPIIAPFDDRTIMTIFQGGKKGAILFNSESSNVLLDAFTQAAKEYNGEALIFTEIEASNQHLDNLANYIKLDK